jgi:hypothetical protein
MDQMVSKRYDMTKQVTKWEQWEYRILGYEENLWSKGWKKKKKRRDKVSLHIVSGNRVNVCYGISRDPAFWNLGNTRNSMAHLVGHAVKHLWKHGRSPISRKVPWEG